MSLFQDVSKRRQVAVQKLRNRADVEEIIFNEIFAMWPLRNKGPALSRWQVAKITLQLASPRLWRAYHAKVRHLVWNFENCPHDLHLADAEWLVRAAPWQLWPERWPAPQRVYDWTREHFHDEEPEEEEPQQGQTNFKCYKCGSRKVTYSQLQTRSADEGLTNYFYCLDCKNRWKC